MFVIIRDFYGNDIFMASSMYSQIPAVGCKNICIHLVPSPMTSLWAFPVQIPTLSIIGKLSWDWGWKLSVSHQFSLIPSNLNILWWKCDYESPLSECVCFNFFSTGRSSIILNWVNWLKIQCSDVFIELESWRL